MDMKKPGNHRRSPWGLHRKFVGTTVLLTGFGIMVGVALPMLARPHTTMASGAFHTYQSTLSELPVRFEYPSDWQPEESRGMIEAYAQVQLYAPESLESRLRAYLVVRALPPKSAGGAYENVNELAGSYRTTLLPSLTIMSERQTVVAGAHATLLELTGTLPRHWELPSEHEEVPVRGQRVFFEHQGRLYELGWMTTPEASAAVEEAFAHLLKTLEIFEKDA